MRTYDVFQHPTMGYRAVKAGFSWPGFFFGWIWCLSKGLVGWALAILGVGIALSLFIDSEPVIGAVSLIVGCIIGSSGNEWRGEKLLAQGFTPSGRFEASNAKEAVAEALSANLGATGTTPSLEQGESLSAAAS